MTGPRWIAFALAFTALSADAAAARAMPSPRAPLRVVVTGATSGLGREMAVQLAERGHQVAVTGRREDNLQETARLIRQAGGEPLVLVGSVTDEAVVRRHYEEIVRAWGGVDWAILNAGVGGSMDGRAPKASVVKDTLDTNVLGAAHWMEAVTPGMVARGSGLIAGVASLAAARGLPGAGPYSASKAALATLLESARVDLRGTGVAVVTIHPGFVKSEMTAGLGKLPMLLETKDAARRILRGLDRRSRVVSFPWPLSFLTRRVLPLLPGFIYDRLAALQRR